MMVGEDRNEGRRRGEYHADGTASEAARRMRVKTPWLSGVVRVVILLDGADKNSKARRR